MILALLMPYGANPVQAAGNNSSSEDQGWETDSGQDAGGRIDQEQPLPDGELPGGGKVQQQSMKLSNLTDSSGSLLVHYKLDETAGSKAANSAVTGAVYDADLQGGTSWTTGVDGGALDFNGTDGHIKLPSGILNDVNDVTLSSWVKLDAQKTWQTVYTFASSQQKYMILSPQGNPGGKPVGVTLVINNGNGEQRISTGAGTELPSGVWSHVVFTLSGHVGTLYVDGKVAAVKEDFTITPADLGVTTSNYIGKPIFSDPYLDGKLDDFRIYKRAISEQEVKEMVSAGNLAMVDADAAALSLGDLSAVTTDLKLPAVGESGASLSWISSKPSVIDSHGKVYPPARGQANEMVTLTATLKKGNTETTKTFEVTVLALSDSLAVKKAVDRLVLPLTINQGHVLPVSGENGTAIQWTAADHRVSISKEGMVSADLSGAGNQRISTTLTAVASLGHEHASRTLDVTVIEPYAGYILSYFRDGQEGQALHFGYSYDGLHWVELNNNAAVLQATIGSKAVRDPFLMRKKDGSFIVIATQGWDNPSLYLWDSPDLTSFTGERLVKLSDFGPRAWAPEAYYDRETDKFVFYWSDPGIGPIFSNTTSDFMNFSPSETYFSTGYPIIDATITAWNNEYYLFFKDERGDNTPSTTGKAIKLAKSSSLAPGSFELVNPGYITDKLVEGPFVLKSFTEDKWYLYYDYFVEGGRFGVSVTDDLAAGIWTPLSADQYNMPAGVRHGGSIPVTQDELNAIIKKWGAPTLDILKVKAAADVAAGIGTSFSELNLPATVDVQLKDGSIRPVNVAWDQAGYNGNVPGEYKLAGSMKLPAGVANPGSKQAEIKVIVSVSNKVRLQAAIVQAKSLDVTKYKPATWEVLAQELAAAEKVNTDVGATQSLVDQVTKKLTAAIQGLELVDPPAPVADKTLLQAVMDQAKALQAAAYTPATWEVLKQALAEGEQVYASLTTTQAEVDQVCAELLQAIAGLKPNLETEGPGNPGTPTPTPTPKPTSTPTVKPSAAPTPKPTSSVTPTPLQTVSPKPAATKSPVTTVLNGIAVAKLTSNERTVTVPASELNGLPLQVQALGAKITVDAQLIAGLLDWESDAVKKNASIIVKLDAVSSVGQIQPAPATGNLQLKASGESFDISVLLRTPDGKEVRLQSVQGGVTIELPYKAESASNKDLLAIYYYNETTSRWEYLGGEVNPDTKTVKVKLQHLSRYAVLSYSHSFRDVPSSHWADTALSVLSAKQIVTGSAEGFFHPTTKTTRAEFTAMLARALQLNAEQPNGQFADVSPEAWYAKEVTAAYQAGLIQGKSDKKFSPDGELTREEMALILVRAMKYKNQILNENSTALSGYADSGQVAPWASQAVNQIIESGLMTGPSSTSFAPKGDVRRAEVAQAIYRFVQTIQQP